MAAVLLRRVDHLDPRLHAVIACCHRMLLPHSTLHQHRQRAANSIAQNRGANGVVDSPTRSSFWGMLLQAVPAWWCVYRS